MAAGVSKVDSRTTTTMTTTAGMTIMSPVSSRMPNVRHQEPRTSCLERPRADVTPIGSSTYAAGANTHSTPR